MVHKIQTKMPEHSLLSQGRDMVQSQGFVWMAVSGWENGCVKNMHTVWGESMERYNRGVWFASRSESRSKGWFPVNP